MKLRQIAFIITMVTVASKAGAQQTKPLYWLSCESGELKNSGSAGGTVYADPPEEVRIAKDLGGYVYFTLPMFPGGTSGPVLQLAGSENRLRLTGPADAMTITLRMRWNGPDKHQDPRQIIACEPSFKQSLAWYFSVFEDGRLCFDWVNESGKGNRRLSTKALVVGEWHDVAMTWENNNNKNGLHFYIDGSDAGISLPWTGGGPMKPSDQPIVIGAVSTDRYLPLNAALANIKLFDQKLSAEQIQAETNK